ncbi:DUF3817 domain-containing protein [Saccharibacillus sp. CPCC 101409]|uniref:DUF3817 domain-containing protein n=1 Tax=Saccharibacillus sp. CPCC 101409 TaxID=3058041 RepID=UPI0026711E24|nr:DUF3817 domain-containing protein [Saccharibacillus sp. CPCC 101409]MDO3410564.1 DUF3817 domain-containing protein [Saccharibacillus sp. CPCC 101409]
MLKTVLGRFRLAGYLEGISFLFLLFVAMPLKYMADSGDAVRISGMIHGILFPLYLIAALHAYGRLRWSFKMLLSAVLLGFLPAGTFIYDAYLRKQIQAGRAYATPEAARAAGGREGIERAG